MDEFLRDLRFDKRAGSLEVAADSNLVKLQQKLLDVMRSLTDVMGPLSTVCTIVEKASNSSFEQMEVSLPEIPTNLDHAVMWLGQAFNNISYTRHFNTLKQITRDPRKMKQLLKEKMRYLLKKHSFYLVTDLSLISLELPKASKNLRKFSWQWQTPTLLKIPLLGHQPNKAGGIISRLCSPKIIDNIHGNQANSNIITYISHSFIDTGVKLYHSKAVPPNKIYLSYPQCSNASRVHPLVRTQLSTNPIREVPLAGRLKFSYSNWAKLMYDLKILNIVQGFEIPFLENPVFIYLFIYLYFI